MRRVRARAAASAAVATACSLLLAVPTAGAADRPDVVIDSPGAGGVLDGSGVTISGRATMHQLAGLQTNRVTGVTIRLSSATHPGPLPQWDSGPTDAFSVPFSWTTPALNWNGPYSVTVVARGLEAVDVNGEEQNSAVRSFSLAVPPASPRDVKATVNPDRTVTVTWARNGEPDLIGYRVQRKEPGGSFTDVGGLVDQSGAPSVQDAVPASGPGGAYVYRVQAIRVGSSGNADSAVGSGFTGGDASVPASGGPPITGLDGAPANPAVAAAAAAAAAPPDLRGFLSRGKGGAPKSSAPGMPKLPGTPDAGYDPTLPYPKGAKRGGNSGAVETITMGAAGLTSNPRALAIPVAAGLILFMVSFHLRLLGRRVDQNGMPLAAPS